MGLLGALMEHPGEFPSLLRVRYSAYLATRLPDDPHLAFCYDVLNRVSRSFAIVILQLGRELRDPICVFYLVLRALDTIEDDMAVPQDVKLPLLHSFYTHIGDPDWTFVCGDKDYRRLMTEFRSVALVFNTLGEGYQRVISDITKRMGEGMAKFITQEVETVAEYDEYCHYVAGLVGLGLSDLFDASGLEKRAPDSLCNSMGLFLQKANIIRDYLEDINELPAPRMFWPREIWGKYAEKLEDFKAFPGTPDEPRAVHCLNHLIVNALSHAEDSLQYLDGLKDQRVFRFCAIPQIMAIGTLSVCYSNVGVFTSVVKMRKGLSALIMDKTNTMADVRSSFAYFAEQISQKAQSRLLPAGESAEDPTAADTVAACGRILAICQKSAVADEKRKSLFLPSGGSRNGASFRIWIVLLAMMVIAFLLFTGKWQR